MIKYIANYVTENIQQFRNIRRIDGINKILMCFNSEIEVDYFDIDSYLTNNHIGFYPLDYEAMKNSVELNEFINTNSQKFNSMERYDVAKIISNYNKNIYKQDIMTYLEMINIGISPKYIAIEDSPKVKEFIEKNIENLIK